MNRSRLAILAGLAVGLALIAATQTCRERSPADATAQRGDTNAKTGGVSPRAADSPVDLRDRDRLRDDEAATPAGVPSRPDEAAPAPPPRDPRREGEGGDTVVEPPTVVAPPASPTLEAAMTAAKAAAQDEIAKVRGEMRRKCWDGLDRGGKGDGGIQLSFSLGFDAEGHVLASAVNQKSREDYISGLETCLAPFAHDIEVPAPGESVSVEVDLELP